MTKNKLKQFLWAGVTNEMPTLDQYSLVITNIGFLIAQLTNLVILLGTPIILGHIHWIPTGTITSAIVLYSIAYWLISKTRYSAGRLVFSVSLLLSVSSLTIFFGTISAVHFLYLPIGIGALMIWPNQRVAQIFLGAVTFAIFLGMWLANPSGFLKESEQAALVNAYVPLFNVSLAFFVTFVVVLYLVISSENLQELLNQERQRADELLRNVFPLPVFEKLKKDGRVHAERVPEVTVLFIDIVGFTAITEKVPPEQILVLLNEIFSTFDEITERHGLEKIKTIGDAYMAVAGVPVYCKNHAERVADAALEMLKAASEFKLPQIGPIEIRIGMDTGPAVAGIIGTKKFLYDLWGSVVNTASRMESYGAPSRIHVSRALYEKLKNKYQFLARGATVIKGLGEVETWWLLGKIKE